MKTEETTPASNTVRRAAEVIIATVALTAAIPAEVRTAPDAAGHADSRSGWAVGEETGARQLPKITLTAERDTIIAGLEAVVLNATREGPLDDSLRVTMGFLQQQVWLTDFPNPQGFPADSAHFSVVLLPGNFSTAVTNSGTLRATVNSVSGYDTGDATATVFVVSQEGPAVTVSLTHDSHAFEEDGDTALIVTARMASGSPRGVTFDIALVSNGRTSSRQDLTAVAGQDFIGFSAIATLREADYELEDGNWVASQRVPVTLLDDDVREGDETFEASLEFAGEDTLPEIQRLNPGGAACDQASCPYPVSITDDEDIPAFALSLSEDEIHEEGETSSTATISITNGKTFGEDQVVTLSLGGAAIPGHDYDVTPGDTDEETRRHEVTLATGASSVEVTFTAIDDAREEGDEKIRLRATHDGNEIGTGTIRLVDRFPGPSVEISFEDVQAPRDRYTAGVATGPFTTRFTFSEPVAGFTEDDIEWQTHSLTTVDTTNIGVLVWDYTEVRPGLEYTARMMPDQNGRLWIVVDPGVATSVGTGDGNQLGGNSLWVELPPNRLMVEPRTLTVEEGDADGAHFLVVPTSPPTGEVTVMVTGMDGTDVDVDWSTWTFGLPYWNGGRGVRVTAAHDADAANEQVRLWVKASGGGYDGRGADLVVNIRDDDGSGGDLDDGEVDNEAAALSLLEGVTAAAAAAALFEEGHLSEAQLAALDLLGNRNGNYDLGDLLSWTARCKRGEVRCGGTPSPASNPVAGAAVGLVAAGRNGRNGHRGSTGDAIHRLASRARRRFAAGRHGSHRHAAHRRTRLRAAWTGFPLLLAAALAWACTDDVLQPPVEADPGYLAVRLTSPAEARDIGARLVVEGPGIDSVRTTGSDLFQSDTSSPTHREVIVSGALSNAPVVEFHVPDRRRDAEYQVRLLEVAAEDYTLRDLVAYTARISR